MTPEQWAFWDLILSNWTSARIKLLARYADGYEIRESRDPRT